MQESITEFFNKIFQRFLLLSGLLDFLDIVLVTIMIYLCVRIIRETRAMQLVKGIMFVAVIYLIVNLFGMEASTNIFRMIFNNIILIIFVLFAPEIRKIH